MKQTKPDPTRNERQARLRAARHKWLKANGFASPEGLIGALMRGEYVLVENFHRSPDCTCDTRPHAPWCADAHR